MIDLYQLVEDAKKVIMQVEANLKFRGRLTLGTFKLDVKINVDDSPIIEKDELESIARQGKFKNDLIFGKSKYYKNE